MPDNRANDLVLTKTCILPTDDVALARQLFDNLVNKQALVLYMVLGDQPDDKLLVQRADSIAGLPGEPRMVVWIRRFENHVEQVSALEGSQGIDSVSTRAFATGFADKVVDRAPRNRPVPNLALIDSSFQMGEAA